MPEQCGIRAGAGQRDADAGRGFDHARGDLDQPHAEGSELGAPQRCGLRQRLAQAPHQPVGGGVEEEPIWLALAERHEVRSLFNWVLWSLIRFSAWPRAQ